MQPIVTVTVVTVWLAAIVGNLSVGFASAQASASSQDQYLAPARNRYQVPTASPDTWRNRDSPPQSELDFDIQVPAVQTFAWTRYNTGMTVLCFMIS